YYASAGDIRHTLVEGRPLLLNGTILGADIPALRKQVTDACERLWQLAADRGVLPPGSHYPPGASF
ncbi:MAG: hypothetical protein IT557_19365, partial [Alphaproteobacteria bacterium]|nr:hypothetical protein [Alphaproteobacteria bacterium]